MISYTNAPDFDPDDTGTPVVRARLDVRYSEEDYAFIATFPDVPELRYIRGIGVTAEAATREAIVAACLARRVAGGT